MSRIHLLFPVVSGCPTFTLRPCNTTLGTRTPLTGEITDDIDQVLHGTACEASP